MGLTREELLEAAPEGVTYVYVERVEDPTVGFQTFWHDGRWHTSLWNSPHCTTMDFWDAQAIDVGETVSHAAGELSRRFAAQSGMLCDWARDLGLESELIGHVADGLGLEAGGGIITLTPWQQEDRPRLALEFLKEHLAPNATVQNEVQRELDRLRGEVTRLAGLLLPPEPQTYTTTGELPPGEHKHYKLHIESQFQPTPETTAERRARKQETKDPWGEEVDKRGY